MSQTSPETARAPLRLCGYCQTWNSRPCGEQCHWSPSDPVFVAPAENDAPPAALSALIEQYVLDLRRNASGGDDYPFDFAKGVAAYLEELIKRAKGNCTCAQAGFPDSCDNCDGLAPTPDLWRPMKSAPTDGTTIIICNADAEEPDPCTAHFRNGKWVCTTKEDWDAADPDFCKYVWHLPEPTHWMSRPTPPQGPDTSTDGNSK